MNHATQVHTALSPTTLVTHDPELLEKHDVPKQDKLKGMINKSVYKLTPLSAIAITNMNIDKKRYRDGTI